MCAGVHAFRCRQASGVSASTCFCSCCLLLFASECVRVCLCEKAHVNGSGGLGVLASWLPLTSTPLPQSTSPCPPHCTDLGYCPAQSTSENSVSPVISILITTRTHVNLVMSRQARNKKEYTTKEMILCAEKIISITIGTKNRDLPSEQNNNNVFPC